jgi:probable phosphoglycerate mutase
MGPPADTHLIAIRHGETEWNCVGRFQGHLNSELNAEGRSQAQALGARLAAERFDLLLSSDLGRALQTASAIAMHTGHEILVDARLRERRMGIFQGLTPAEVQERYPQDYARFKSHDPDYVIPEGESARQLFQRCVACFTELAERHAGLTLATVTHGGVLAMLYRVIHGIPLGKPHPIPIRNASYNALAWESGAWRVEAWGDTIHLPEGTDFEEL